MRKYTFTSFLFTSFLLCSLALCSQQVKKIDTKEGLVNGIVKTFAKDSLGYMWIGTDQGLSRYSGVEFKSYLLQNNSQTFGSGVVKILNVKGKLYLICSDGTLYSYQYDKDEFKKLLKVDNVEFLSFTTIDNDKLIIGLSTGFIIFNTKTNTASNIKFQEITLNREIVYHQNKIYSGTSKGIAVFYFNATTNMLTFEKKLLENKDVISFAIDDDQKIWAGTEVDGLFLIDGTTIKQKLITQTFNKTYAIRKINFTKNKQTLVAVDRLGLFVVDKNLNILKKYSYNADDKNSLSQNSIYEIYVDKKNAYWLGMREGGINILYASPNIFKNIKHQQNDANSISNNSIRSIFEASNGDLWFGTENGVSKLSNQKWENYNAHPKLYNTAVLSVGEYQNKIILGTYGEGLLEFNTKNNQVNTFNFDETLKQKFIFQISSFDNDLWIGGSDGPLTYIQNNNVSHTFPVGLVRSLAQGYDDIWYAATSSGFFEINKRNLSIRKIAPNTFNTINETYYLDFDNLQNCIWIATKNGLYKYTLNSEKVEHLGDLLTNEIGTVYAIKKDNMQNLYLATISGLWRYNIRNNNFRKYDLNDGLEIEKFGIGAALKCADGTIAFGGPQGAVLFDPNQLSQDEPITNIYLANFQINGKEPDSITIPNNINYNKELHLNYDKNSLSFNFETIKYHGSKRNLFQWQLVGFDNEVKSTYGNQKISYSNLKPGKYTLQYTAFNADSIKANSNSINIFVNKPFWKTWWAFGAYFFVSTLIIYLLYRLLKANDRKRFDENRIKFFVEVAHDIRTPVSLIQLLVKQLSNQENVEKSIELIHKNTQNLSEYVTQLLDFQKIDNNQLKLQISKVDLKDCLADIIANFTPILQENSIDIHLDVNHIPVWFDVAKMNRIFYNLISNAIKYSNEGGEISIKAKVKNNLLKIDFIDNGIGIPEKQQELIFQRFTRGTNVSNKGIPGTGLGLMLSKKIVELHGGKILLESKENIGSKFTIELPLGTQHYTNEKLITIQSEVSDKEKVSHLIDNEKLILLVEDNKELREAIKNELEKNYKVIEAADGKEGLLLALSKNPDLIITDVMMPKMNGKELCQVLKTNFKTSHIPIIMLTALVEVDDKLKGLETGADAYVEKPFNISILNVTIQNLLKVRENLGHIIDNKNVEKQLTPDETFISDLIAIIKDNLTQSDFSIDTLCDMMGLSRSNLFRKLKGLINMSPSDLIIKIKLNHAEEMMRNKPTSRISDIAYESGFQDPKYFSTIFKKHYNKTPKEFIDQL